MSTYRKDYDIDDLISKAEYALEANAVELRYLYNKWADKIKWEKVNAGKLVTLGLVDERPVTMQQTIVVLNDIPVLVYEMASELVDYRLTDKYLTEKFGHHPKLNYCFDSDNFHRIVNSIKDKPKIRKVENWFWLTDEFSRKNAISMASRYKEFSIYDVVKIENIASEEDILTLEEGEMVNVVTTVTLKKAEIAKPNQVCIPSNTSEELHVYTSIDERKVFKGKFVFSLRSKLQENNFTKSIIYDAVTKREHLEELLDKELFLQGQF